MSKKLFTILSALLLVSMLLGACGTKATETPAAQTEAPVVTEAPVAAYRQHLKRLSFRLRNLQSKIHHWYFEPVHQQ